jgi:hypothetical protein
MTTLPKKAIAKLMVVAALCSAPWTLAQFEFPITGQVTTSDGVPVSGAKVYGSYRQQAPFTPEQTETNARSFFRLVAG